MPKKTRFRKPPQVAKHWQVGLTEMPTTINPLEGEFYLLLAIEDELIVGSRFVPQGEIQNLAEFLQQICQKPMMGAPRLPTSIRFDNRVKKKKAKLELAGVTITLGHAPQLDEAITAMAEHFRRIDQKDTWDYDEYPAATMHRFFALAHAWATVAPWETFNDGDLFELNCPQHKMRKWYASIMGNAGQSYGILFFRSTASLQNFSKASKIAAATGKIPIIKEPIIALNYDDTSNMDDLLRKAAMGNGWPVIAPNMFPILEIYGPGNQRCMATGETVRLISDCLEAMITYLIRYGSDIAQEKLAGKRAKIRAGAAEFILDFPISVDYLI
jgi:hypothetical protein